MDPTSNELRPITLGQSRFLAINTIFALFAFSWLLNNELVQEATAWVSLLAIASLQHLIINHHGRKNNPEVSNYYNRVWPISYTVISSLWGGLIWTIYPAQITLTTEVSLLVSLSAVSVMTMQTRNIKNVSSITLVSGLLPIMAWLASIATPSSIVMVCGVFGFCALMLWNIRASAETSIPNENYIENFNPTSKSSTARTDDHVIINTIPDLVFKINHAGDVLWGNLAFNKFINTSGSVKKVNIRDLLTPTDSAIFENVVSRAKTLGRTRHDTMLSSNDSSIPYNITLVSVGNHNEKSFVCVGRNLSERLAAEKERTELYIKLQQAQKMESIGHLTGGIAHDFNNILTSIIGYSQLTIQKSQVFQDKKLDFYHKQILESGLRAKDLIAQLLSFSRNQEQKLDELNLNKLLVEVVDMLRPVIPSSIEIDFEMDDIPLFVKANPVQFHQVIMNLCINARDAMDNKGRMHIALAQVRHQGGYCQACHTPFGGEYIELSISDTGHGIKPELMEHIFEPFISTKEIGKGTGMGLSTVHGIVHSHNGHIAVESTPNVGTTFRIYLPTLDSIATSQPNQVLRKAS